MLESLRKRQYLFLAIMSFSFLTDLITKWYAGSFFFVDGKINCPYPQCSIAILSYGTPCLNIVEPNREVQLIHPIIENFFEIHLLNNTGAAWSFLSGNNHWFIVFNILFITGAFYYMFRKANHIGIISFIAFSLIIGGAMGNFYDRLVHNSVRDFLSFFIPLPNGQVYAYPVFNGADIFIFIGATLYFIDQMILERFRKKEDVIATNVEANEQVK